MNCGTFLLFIHTLHLHNDDKTHLQQDNKIMYNIWTVIVSVQSLYVWGVVGERGDKEKLYNAFKDKRYPNENILTKLWTADICYNYHILYEINLQWKMLNF